MLFNSLQFAAFLVVVLFVHYVVIPARQERARRLFLLAASYVFYGSWNPPFVLLLLYSTVLDYWVARRMVRTPALGAKRALLGLSLLGNLGVLAFFKYGNFLAETYLTLVALGPAQQSGPLIDVILPVGISFYTFQSLSYSMDVYRGRLEPATSFWDLALYVSFFPQLVAGPIVRAREFLPQLEGEREVREADVEESLARFAGGLIKKVIFADTLAIYVDQVWDAPADFGGPALLLAAYAFAFQIYFDFSGYSDMAIGLARLFGFRLPENFLRPYLSTSPREFWRRWHITLSTWLRDYLYISLGGNRRSEVRTQINLLVTMLLGGLWHGAAWSFVVWGGYHGMLLVLQRWATPRFPVLHALPGWARIGITFHLVVLGWVFFRSPDLASAGEILGGLSRMSMEITPATIRTLAVLAVAALAHIVGAPQQWQRGLARRSPWIQGVAYASVAVLVYAFSPATDQFIYFQF